MQTTFTPSDLPAPPFLHHPPTPDTLAAGSPSVPRPSGMKNFMSVLLWLYCTSTAKAVSSAFGHLIILITAPRLIQLEKEGQTKAEEGGRELTKVKRPLSCTCRSKYQQSLQQSNSHSLESPPLIRQVTPDVKWETKTKIGSSGTV